MAPSPPETAPAPVPQDASAASATASDASAAPSLLELSRNWAKDSDLSGLHPVSDVARCPSAQHEPGAANAALVPPPFVPLAAIATHACDAVLWVYLGCTQATEDGAACQSWKERLVLEPVPSAAAAIVADLEPVHGGNSGGLFVPFAFSRDDQRVLLRAFMFSPGAGGGAVDYGVGTLARTARQGASPTSVSPFPARDLSFYDDDGCAIGLAASDLTPTYAQPGFPADNGGALVDVDLATLKSRVLAKERDTTYAVKRLDEKARSIEVEVTKHTFGKDCPREEGALGCSKGTKTSRTIPLPACAPPRR